MQPGWAVGAFERVVLGDGTVRGEDVLLGSLRPCQLQAGACWAPAKP